MGSHYIVHDSLSERRHRPGPLTDADAAKRRGQAARDKYGLEYYRTIGKKGGLAIREKLGSEHYAHIGRMGGEHTKAKYGAQHYARIGAMGRQAQSRARVQGQS